MLENQLEEKLRKKTKELGGRAYKFVSPGNSGVPDRIVVLPGAKIGFAEMKRPGEIPRKLQEKQMQFLNKLGFIAEVVDSEEAMKNFIKKLENQVKL